ncbi:MAG TPA: hypothetical protein DFS52_28595 [Myxococcales bacterium]|nr:hypothetical protein [Myxococcales bacterium]
MASAPRVEPSRDARELDLPATPPAELYRCPVRRRYLWQLLRYHRANHRWRPTAPRRRRGDARALSRRVFAGTQEECSFYPRPFAEAGVDWRDLRRPSELAGFPELSRRALQERYLELFGRRVGRADIEEGWFGITSGSTGEPVRFFMDGESSHFFAVFIRFL